MAVETKSSNSDELSNDDFEFAFVMRSDLGDSSPDFTADETRQVYPLFGRDLLLAGGLKSTAVMTVKEREATSSSSTDGLEVIRANSYCAWTPRSVPSSPVRYKKSGSTGSESRRWRIRDLLASRSHSDGKEKFMFLAHTEKNLASSEVVKGKAKSATKGKANGKGGDVTEMDMVTAHRLHYSKNSVPCGKRSFLPYKQDLVGLLGLSRSHPF